MKNTNFKTKLIARILLIVLLLASVVSLAGCDLMSSFFTTMSTDDPKYGHCGVDSEFKYFDDYQKLEEFINANTSTYTYITFNADNQNVYLSEPYEVYVMFRFWNGEKLYYIMDYLVIRGSMVINETESENQITVSFSSQNPYTYKDVKISEDAVLEIKALPDKVDKLEEGYCMHYGVYVEENKLMDFSVKSTSQKLSEDDFLEVCDVLKQYLVIVK